MCSCEAILRKIMKPVKSIIEHSIIGQFLSIICQGLKTSQHTGTNNTRTPQSIRDMRQVRKHPDSTISKVLTVIKLRMITTLNRKLLEKQRVQNHFASDEVHFFLQCQCYCQFWKSFKPVCIQI